MRNPKPVFLLATVLALGLGSAPAWAQKHYDEGASDTEIRIGNVTPMTGSFSEYSGEPRAQAAYFKMINDQGGINGRKITFVSLDDGSDPRKAVRLAQQLVEQDKVLALFSTFGVASNLGIREYANQHQVPHLFVQSASAMYDDPAHFPWTMGFFASYRTEAAAYGRYIVEMKPGANIGVLFSDDDAGREFLAGLREGLGDRADQMIGKVAAFKFSQPGSVDTQVEALKDSGADVFVNLAVGRFTTEAIRHAYDIGWRPLQLIPNGSLSAPQFMDPAGAEKAVGIISNARSKGWLSARSRSDPDVAAFLKWRHDYLPEDAARDALNVSGYERAQTLVEVLRRCGDDLTRANVMKQAASLDFKLGMLRPGIGISTSPTDYQPIKQLYLVRFDGKDWVGLRPTGGS